MVRSICIEICKSISTLPESSAVVSVILGHYMPTLYSIFLPKIWLSQLSFYLKHLPQNYHDMVFWKPLPSVDL